MNVTNIDYPSLLAIDQSFSGTAIATYCNGKYEVTRLKTQREKVKCPVCGKSVGDPNSISHKRSEIHKNALDLGLVVEDAEIVSSTVSKSQRIRWISDQVRAMCVEKKVKYAIIEGLSFGSHGHATFDLGGLYYAICDSFLQCGVAFVVVPPTTAKQFWTGKGNASKDDMIEETKKRRVEIPFNFDDNCNDAFVFLVFLMQFLKGDLPKQFFDKVETSWKRKKINTIK